LANVPWYELFEHEERPKRPMTGTLPRREHAGSTRRRQRLGHSDGSVRSCLTT
jgi:hypothetical protein